MSWSGIGRFLRTQGVRIVVAVAGTAVLLAGIALIVLPGPAILVIPAGLAILATQFTWARRLLDDVRRRTGELKDRVTHRFDDEGRSERSGREDAA